MWSHVIKRPQGSSLKVDEKSLMVGELRGPAVEAETKEAGRRRT